MARRLLSFAILILLAVAPRARAQAPPSVRPGEVRSGDLVVLGRDAVVNGVVTGSLVAVLGNVRISGRVEKDVITFGGDVLLGPAAAVGGDLLAIGGVVTAPERSRGVKGRVLTVGALEAAFAAELQTSPLASRRLSGLLVAFRLLLLLLWLVIGLLLLRFLPRPLSAAASLVPGRPTTVAVFGTAATMTGALASVFFLLALPATVGLAVTGLLLAAFVVAKAFGLAAVFVALGRRLTRGARRGSPLFGDPAALALGLALLGLLSLVPVAGPVLWAVASLLGIGAALAAVSRRGAVHQAF